MPLGPPISRMGDCRILATYASGGQFAREACAMFFQRNTVRVSQEYLPDLLSEGPFNELASIYMYYSHPYGVPVTYFDVKPLIRHIIVTLNTGQGMDGLAERVGLLMHCPALREVELLIWKYPAPLKRIIGSIRNAFKPLEEKLGCRLTIRVDCYPLTSFPPSHDIWCGEVVFGNLKEMEGAIRDQGSDL